VNAHFYTDTMFSTSKSLRGNKCAQVFTNGAGYDLFYPMRKKFEAGESLNSMIRSIDVPKDLVSNGAVEETGGCFGQTVKENKIKQRLSEPNSPWQKWAESSIRETKSGIKCSTFRARFPRWLWDYCGEWVPSVRQLAAHNIPPLSGRVPSEIVGRFTPDISEYTQFNWYEYFVWFYDPTVQFHADAHKLALWIGVTHTMWVAP
jgi:hypothetical protein